MAFPIDSPLPIFYDRNGDVLDAGFIYIGVVNTNPETNPSAVYWDAAQTQPAPQPLRTVRGYIARNGAPANVYVGSDYSIVVRDRNQQLVLNDPVSSTLSGSGGSATIGFIQAGTGAVLRTAQSKMRDIVDVKDFGAVANGAADDTIPIQSALDYAGSVGIKTVMLSDAGYLITSITVPAGVELRGNNTMAPNHSGGVIRGSHLIIRQSTGTAVTLGNSSKLKGIAFWYPEQDVTDPTPTLIPYPLTINGLVRGVQIEDVWCSGAYDFILVRDLATLNNIGGYPLRRGIYVQLSPDVTRINNVHFNPNYLVAASAIPKEFYSYCGENLGSSVLKIDSADGLMASNIFGYCQTYGVDTDSGSGSTLPSLTMVNFGFDLCKVAFNMGGNASNFGISAANGYATPILGTDRTVTAGVYFRGNCTGSNVRLSNVNFYGTSDSNVVNSGKTQHYVKADSGAFQNILQIDNTTFRHHTVDVADMTNMQETRVVIDGQTVPIGVNTSPAQFRATQKFRIESVDGLSYFLPTIGIAGRGNNDATNPSFTVNRNSRSFTITNDGMQIVVLDAATWQTVITGSINTAGDGGVSFAAFMTTNVTAGRIAIVASRSFTIVTNAGAQTTLRDSFGLYKFAQADNPFTIANNDAYAAIVLNVGGTPNQIWSREIRGSANRGASVRAILDIMRLTDMERHQ